MKGKEAKRVERRCKNVLQKDKTFSFVLSDDFSITSWRFEVPGFQK
jgi:hypothetical protein